LDEPTVAMLNHRVKQMGLETEEEGQSQAEGSKGRKIQNLGELYEGKEIFECLGMRKGEKPRL